MSKNVRYSEPGEYIPKAVRKELKIGEFAPKKAAATTPKKTVKKTAKKK